MQTRRNILAALAAASVLATAPHAFAAFPEKPMRLIVPFPAGGATDVVARALGQRLSQMLKQPVVVENKAGAGGNIGADFVAKSAPDGYTVLIASAAEVTINEFLYAKMSYNPAKDLAPVAKLASAPLALVVNSESPADSVQGLVKYIKSRPDGAELRVFRYRRAAAPGGGAVQAHVREKMSHVPYKGGAPAMNDLLGGQVEICSSQACRPRTSAHPGRKTARAGR